MPYWDGDCEFRRQNAKIAWNEIKKLVIFLRENEIDASCYLFEIGERFIFDDSIKIVFKSEYFDKCKRNNMMINHSINDGVELFMFSDADCFFSPSQYPEILADIQSISGNHKFFTYNLLDIEQNQKGDVFISEFDIDYIKLDEMNKNENFIWRHSWGAGTLGGFFMCPFNDIKKINGFNENVLTWGADDDEAHVRLKTVCVWEPKMWRGPYHLYHPKDYTDPKFYIPVFTEEYYAINKIPRIN